MISFGNVVLYNVFLQMIWKTSLDPKIGVVHDGTDQIGGHARSYGTPPHVGACPLPVTQSQRIA